MYPSSSSSSSQGSMSHSSTTAGGGGGLTRYGSAPGSFLTTAVESVVNGNNEFASHGSHHSHLGTSLYFPSNLASSSLNLESTSKAKEQSNLQRSIGFNELTIGGAGSGRGGGGVLPTNSTTPLVRHSSSPARFLNQLATAAGDTVSMGRGSYNSKGSGDSGRGITRLNSQLSFTRQEALSQIAEENEDIEGTSIDNGHRKSTHSYASASSFSMGSWEDNNSIMFSVTPSKRAKHISNDIVNGLDDGETQFQFGLSQTALEMASMDRLLHIPEDSVPCKIRAKRGCATHPRSIAERERRTRISGKLKKLQDLVPNMDKQTSYADMLDLAVQHIRTLQDQVQNLNTELENCKCGCKKSSQ
ncbi:transcription factor bHLH128-like isoform X2 [Solanum dulcamara]|uniref:transcription factor bHLH128-like isoform X2 n=1 Tax=Solanum dulcamara TaxID=45834 RepID=UPI0024869E5A|nr:transcription factor bHLH128-like isoform X2 [Solanum dulcamara]